VPLSEHEQRLLEQMERALVAEDPKFVSSLRGTDLRRHHRRRVAQAAIGFVLGVVLLFVGLISGGGVIAVSVLGFVLMLSSAVFATTSWKRVAGGTDPGRPAPARGNSRGNARPAKRSVSDRFEERWRRRREQG
jgi:hypothetical protein